MQVTSKKRLIITTITVLLVADVFVLFPHPFMRALMYGLYATGRAGVCDTSSSGGAFDHLRRRTDAILRNTAAAIKVRNEDGLTLWQTLRGPFWTPERDKLGFVPLISEQEIRVYGKMRKGDIVLDGGANIGDFTRAALEDGASLVVAIEIAPDTLQALRRNMEAEISAGRVIIYPKGVWDSDAELTLLTEFASGVDTVVPDGAPRTAGVRVPLTTIDKMVAELKLPRVDFIKLDVEGAELRAAVGARDVIRRFRPRLAFDSESFTREDVATLERELRAVDETYTMIPGPCIFLQSDKSIRADVVRFEPSR